MRKMHRQRGIRFTIRLIALKLFQLALVGTAVLLSEVPIARRKAAGILHLSSRLAKAVGEE